MRLALERHEIAGVVNCAGLCRGPADEVWASQVDFVTSLMKICLVDGAEKAPRFLQVSTERVYGWKVHPKVPAGEQDPSERWSVEVEKVLQEGYPSQKLCLVRPANVYGAGAKPRYNSAIATWIDMALGGQDLEVHGDGHLRNFVHIQDVQAVIRQAVVTGLSGAVDVRPTSSDTISLPASIIAGLAGVKVVNPPGASSCSEPASSAIWTLPAQDPLAMGLIAAWTPLQDGLREAFKCEQALRTTAEQNPTAEPPTVDGDRGRMVELFGPGTQRVYEIVVEPGFVRGNHCHKIQYEEFYVSEGRCMFELQPGLPEYLPQALALTEMSSARREKLNCKPTYMHTLWNPSPLTPALVIVSSTHKYIPNSTPDCYWPQNDVKSS